MVSDKYLKNGVYYTLIEDFRGEIALNAFALKRILYLDIITDVVITREILKNPIHFR